MDFPKFSDFVCVECGVKLVKKKGKFGELYACPDWKEDGSGCKGHIYYPGSNTWKVASRTQKGVMYTLKFENHKLYCDCPASGFKKVECWHKKIIKEKYGVSEEAGKEMEKMFNQMKEKGHFKEFSTFEEWQKKGRKYEKN